MRLLTITSLALLAVVLMADAADAAGSRRATPPRPDLAISATSFTPEFAFKGESASSIRFCDRTTNLGKGSTGRRLHNTMSLRGPDGVRHVVARRDAPKLAGSPRVARGDPPRHFSHRGCGRGEGVLNLPPGAYDVVICADTRLARETRDGNNCLQYRKSFFVAKRTWTGAATGSGTIDINQQPQAETWIASSLVYTFDRSQYRRGIFRYTVTAGNVSWKTAASANGCNKSGAAVNGSPQGTLTIDYLANTYVALGSKNPAFTYVVTNDCDLDNPTNGPSHPLFLNSGIGGPPRPLPFGTEQLAATTTELDESVLTWSLQ